MLCTVCVKNYGSLLRSKRLPYISGMFQSLFSVCMFMSYHCLSKVSKQKHTF